jgi:hypothetical protein
MLIRLILCSSVFSIHSSSFLRHWVSYRKYYITVVHNCILSDIRGKNETVKNMEVMVKKRIAITVSEEILKWVDRKVKDTTFATRSHAVEHALTELRERMEKKE